MNLFLDTISPKNALILFNKNKDIITTYYFDVRLNESTRLIEELDSFLQSNELNYSDLENIVVINWPGSFTWVRTTILLVNTINFVIKKNITTLTYFDLFNNTYPIIKASSKKDSFIQINKESDMTVMQNTDIWEFLKTNNINKIYWDVYFWKDIETISDINYEYIIQKIVIAQNQIVTPFYFKKPNIC